jgi:hypothetical protein
MQNLWRKSNSRDRVLPDVPLTGLLFPQDPPGVLADEKALGVVVLGPVGMRGLLVVVCVFETKRLPSAEPFVVGLERFAPSWIVS